MTTPITLATLPNASAQEVFDQAALHLLRQNKRSMELNDQGEEAGCAYRGADGLACAAGCFMSDAEHHQNMEGCGWDQLVAQEVVPEEHANLIGELQTVHDGYSPDEWLLALRSLAERFCLNANVLDLPLDTAA